MKPSKLIDIAIACVALVLLGFYAYKNVVSLKKDKLTTGLGIVKANDILKYKTQIPTQILNTTVTSSACTLFLKTSAELSMNDYANEYIDHQIDNILKTCSGAIPSALQTLIDEAILKCKSSTREKITNECYGALIAAKTKSVATVIRPDVDPKELDATILLHLIADGFHSGNFFEHPEKSLAIVNALLEKEPNYLSGYKVKLMLLSMSSLNGERYKNMFEDTLEDARRLKSNDPDILELTLIQRGEVFKQSNDSDDHKRNTQDFVEYLEHEASLHPKEWIYDYYKARAIYDEGKGDYHSTLALVEGALKKAPDDFRLKQTLENLKSDDENKRKYPFMVSVGFSLNDL